MSERSALVDHDGRAGQGQAKTRDNRAKVLTHQEWRRVPPRLRCVQGVSARPVSERRDPTIKMTKNGQNLEHENTG
jgi:hypothetical protein